MKTYADYTWYKNEYHGTMKEKDFRRLAVQAGAIIDGLTLDRIPEDWEADEKLAERTRLACCAAADLLFQQSKGGEVATASNNGYMETYVTSGKRIDQRLYAAVERHLGRTGLMYRGF